MFFKANMLRGSYTSGKRWICCLSIVLLLLSLFPAAVLGAESATMAIVTSHNAIVQELTESDIRDVDDTVIEITLTNNTWADQIGFPNEALIFTLKSGFSVEGATEDTNQWHDLINADDTTFELETAVNSNDTIKITIPSADDYNIHCDQTVTFTPPSALLQSSFNIPEPESFTITADPQATLSGSLTTGVSESKIVLGEKELTITLVNCQWASDVTTDATKREKLFHALTATGTDAGQWNTYVYNALIATSDPSTVITQDTNAEGISTVVTITLPPVPSYNISGPQTVDLSSLDKSLLMDMDDVELTTNLTNIIDPSFTINSDANTISLTTTPQLFTESSIKTGGTLEMALSDNTWADDIADNLARQTALLNGFTVSTDVAAWNSVKAAILESSGSFEFLDSDNEKLVITIPEISDYSISANQLVTVKVPSTVLTQNYPLSNELSFTINADPAVAVSGTLTAGVNEMDIVNGGKTIVASLTNATWDPVVTINKDDREALIDCLLASTGVWPEDAIATIKVGATYTLDNSLTTVTITLPPVPGFNITELLTITPEILSSLPIDCLPGLTYSGETLTPFTITPINNQSASISGTVFTATESDIVTGGKTLVITLENDAWAQDVVSTPNKLEALKIGIVAKTDTWSWNLVQNAINSSNVVRTSDKVLTITLPPVIDYALDSDEMINVSIPPETMATSGEVIRAGSFTVKAVTATLSGTAVAAPLDSKSVVSGGKTIVITLGNATWASDVTTVSKLDDLLDQFQPNNYNWSIIKNQITTSNISINSDKNVLTIKLPPIKDYTWDENLEQVEFSISDSMLPSLITEKLGSTKTLTATSLIRIGIASIMATLSGSGLNMGVPDVVLGSKKIIITLSYGTWDPKLETDIKKFNALVSGFKVTSDSASWALVQAALKSANANASTKPFELTNNELTITLPAVPGYDPVKGQTVRLTIPKTVLVSAKADVIAEEEIEITVPSYDSRGSLESIMGEEGSFANYVNTVPLQQIFLVVPKKLLTSVVCKQTAIGDTMVNSLDVYTDISVESVNVAINETEYNSSAYITSGSGKKFNIGFATAITSTESTLPPDALISVLNTEGTKLQTDVPIKISGSKTFNFATKTDLSGSYSLYKLVNNNSLLTNILKYYVPADITVETP